MLWRMDDPAPDPRDALDMSWGGQRRRMLDSTLSEAGREAGVWAIDRLSEYLGADWPAEATAQGARFPGSSRWPGATPGRSGS
jgi:hypothetical protein